MLKVLSTKLNVDELDRFTTMAKQQGESKAGFLKRLVLERINSGGKLDVVESVGKPHPAAPSKIDPVNEDYHVDLLPPPKEGLPVNQDESEGRPETPSKSSIGKGWLFALLFLLWLKSRPSIAVDRSSALITQSPQVDAYGLYTHTVGNTIVYSSSPIPFW